MSFVLALVVLVAFFLVEGSLGRMAYAGQIDPVSGAWMANVLMLLFGTFLMFSRTEGDAPLTLLGRWTSALLRFVKFPLGWIAGRLHRRWMQYPRYQTGFTRLQQWAATGQRSIHWRLLRLFVASRKLILRWWPRRG